MSDKSDWYLGAGYSFTNLKRRDSPFVRLLADSLGLYGAGKFRQLNFNIGIEIDTRDRKVASTRGLYAALDVAHYPDILDLNDRYTRYSGEMRFYLSDTLLTDFTLAFRFGGQRLYGTFPFFESAFLGGKSSLRGFRNYRFAGDAAVYGSADLRFYLKRIWLIFPADFGLFTFTDAGRVWIDGESPGDWHTDTGVGIWLAPVRRDFTISIGAGFSNEATQVIAGLGFAF
jgi:outer membrane protein assembly factor BamA